MSNIETQYFALLRSALWDAPVAIEGPIDWNGVMQLAQHQANQALLGGVASQMTDDNRPSDDLLGKMRLTMRNNLLCQLRLKQILASALELLREHNIEPVLLKGFSLARLYPNPNLRQFGDVDLFVGLADFHQACILLRTLPGSYNWGEEMDEGKHYNIEFGNYPMEIHRVSADVVDPKDAATYLAIEHEGLYDNTQHVNFEDLDITIPSKEFMVFYTFFHAWEHFLTTGVGWRQISDIALTLHAYHGQLDLDKLRQWFTAMHLIEPWQAFGFLIVEHLGLPEAEVPFYDPSCRRTAQRLYRNVMEVGNFSRNSSFKRRHPKNILLRKLHAFIGIFVDFFYRAHIFPSVAFREMRASFKLAWQKAGKTKDFAV
jgi:hypothetical protein